MPRFRSAVSAGSVLLAALLAVTACGEGAGAGGDESSIAHASGTRTPAPYHTAYLAVPVAQGYFKDAGIDVTTTLNDGTTTALQALDAGQADIASGSTASLISAKEQGLDVVTFLAEKSAPIAALAVLPDSPAKTTKDLIGKTIGVSELASGTVPLLKAQISRAGGNPDGVKMVAIGAGPEAAAAVKQGRVDAFMGTTGQIGLIRSAGLDVRAIEDPSAPTGFDTGFFTTREALKSKHDALVKFAQGVISGWIYSTENPRCAIRSLWEVYPETKPTGVDEEKAMTQAVDALEYHQSETKPVQDVWGGAEPESIDATIEALVAGGAAKKSVPAADVWTSEIVDEAAKGIDEKAIRAEAAKKSC